MKLDILFWCYKEVEICVDRLQLMRHYNPDTPIYVLFGGEHADAPRFENELRPYFDDFYVFPEQKDPFWKWRYGDVLISRWFSDRGYELKWDSILVIQWDMLVFAPVATLFGQLRMNELLLPGLRPAKDVDASWDDPESYAFVFNRPEYPNYYDEYTAFLSEYELSEQDVWCCAFIVTVLPYDFLDRFARRKSPGTGFLEITIPTLAKYWGFDFCTDHPYSPWLKGSLHPYCTVLNTVDADCSNRYVLLHLLDPWGLRIFHPHRRSIHAEKLSHSLPPWLNFLRCNEWDYADLLGDSTRSLARHAIAGYDLALPDPVTARPAICLNMIVRNEAHKIEGVLDTVAPHISSWVIVDTGSDDGTQDLVRSRMARLGIPGQLYQRPWRSFGHNRTEALSLAQDHGDYIWILEAGETVVGVPDFTRLGADIYWLRYVDESGETFWRAQLFRDGLSVRYEGALDAYPACDNPDIDVRLNGDYHIVTRGGDALNVDRRKEVPRGRALVLIDADGKPEDARSVYLLAQSYFAKSDFGNARECSERRVQMGGREEEVYAAMWIIAESMAQLGAPWLEVQDAYLRASDFRPTRAEPLHAIAKRHRLDRRYRLGYLFAERAAKIPFPEQDTLFVHADTYAWCATDEQAVCACWIGEKVEAFELCRRLLARPDIPDHDRQRISGNRDISVPAIIEATSPYPSELVGSIVAGKRDAEVTVSLVAGPDQSATEHTLNWFLNCCTDVSRIGRFLLVYPGMPALDRARLDERAMLRERYGFLELADCGPDPQLAQIRALIHGRFWLHLGQGWRFFAPEDLITRLTAVLDTEAQVFQVGINFADAVALTGASAAEQTVRRAPDAGRYVLTDAVASGPAMFETARLDQVGGLDRSEADPIAALRRRAAAAGLHTASLDEVLCISAI